jgi:hypothetical protein
VNSENIAPAEEGETDVNMYVHIFVLFYCLY